MSYGIPQEILDNDTLMEVYETGFYEDGLGNIKKVPSDWNDRSLIYKAIIKRDRKAKRNLLLHANTWIGDKV